MANEPTTQLTKKDWLLKALQTLAVSGVEGIKVVTLAKQLGVTSGSFYWHFSNRPQMYQELLDYWEVEFTDKAIEHAKAFTGSAVDRIWSLMKMVMNSDLAGYDVAVGQWAQSSQMANKVFTRAVEKRFSFATWMFMEAGFDKAQAEARGRMMVVYMMGESILLPENYQKRKELLKLEFEILVAKTSRRVSET